MDERRSRLRFAWAALLLGLPSVVAGGAVSGFLVYAGLQEQSWLPALFGLAGCCGVLALVFMSGRYLRWGPAGLRPGRWPRADRGVWRLLVLGMIAAAAILILGLGVTLMGLSTLDLNPVLAGLTLQLFGPTALVPAFMLLARRRDADAAAVRVPSEEMGRDLL